MVVRRLAQKGDSKGVILPQLVSDMLDSFQTSTLCRPHPVAENRPSGAGLERILYVLQTYAAVGRITRLRRFTVGKEFQEPPRDRRWHRQRQVKHMTLLRAQ